MTRHPMSSEDAFFWHIEDPKNPLMVTGVLILESPIEYLRLRTTIEHRLLEIDRFRQRIAPPLSPWRRPRWDEDPDFDLTYHLRFATLPPPADQMTLQHTVSLLASTPLDLSRPLWQFHLIEEYDQGSALICRMHHSIADGAALVHVLLSLADTDPDAPWPQVARTPSRRRQWRGRFLAPIWSDLRSRRQIARRLVRTGMEALSHPVHWSQVIHQGRETVATVARLALASPDPMTVFKGELGTLKRAAWSAELPLCDVKAISREFGGTVNDVMLTIVTGALGRYLRASHAELHGLEIRATIPVNVRNPGTEDELGNCVGTLLLDLPLCVPNPAERLAELKRRMGRIKDSPEAVVTSIGLRLVGRLGARAQQLLVGAVGSKATLVVSNVRGPEERIYLAGAAVGEILAWVPKSGGLGISVSILSYAGGIRLGIITDAGLVPDPETLATGFEAEFEALLELAREMEEMTSPSDIMVELDDALETLDSLLKATVSESKSLSAETRLQCQASTKAGRQCKNRALPGSGFCHVHT